MEKNIITRLEETKYYIRQKTSVTPKIGIILGSGLGSLMESSSEDVTFSYSELPHFSPSTVEGHSGRLIMGQLADRPIVVMQGRIHYYEGYALDEVIYPVRLMRMLGIEYLVVTAAVGGINRDYRAGDIIIVRDHINLMGANCLRGAYYPQFGERFPDMTAVYDRELRTLAVSCARRNRITTRAGVYVSVAGPSYETPAEIKAFGRLGADMVGMSVVPEATAAHQMGVKVLGLAYVANTAGGKAVRRLRHADVIARGTAVSNKIGKIIAGVVGSL